MGTNLGHPFYFIKGNEMKQSDNVEFLKSLYLLRCANKCYYLKRYLF